MALIGALLFTAFAAMVLWIGFGPGERSFSGGASVGGLGFGGESNAMIGRIAFGAIGIPLSLIAARSWLRLMRPRNKESQVGP